MVPWLGSYIGQDQMGVVRMGNKSIYLLVLSDTVYETLISDPPAFRRYLQLWKPLAFTPIFMPKRPKNT
jgi:hypothetical protein